MKYDHDLFKTGKYIAISRCGEEYKFVRENVNASTFCMIAEEISEETEACQRSFTRFGGWSNSDQPHDFDLLELRRIDGADEDYWNKVVRDGIAEAERAMAKFPQPNYVVTKIAEEAGEVVKEAVHLAEGRGDADKLRGEVVQLVAMIYRLVVEGDGVLKCPSLAGVCSEPVEEGDTVVVNIDWTGKTRNAVREMLRKGYGDRKWFRPIGKGISGDAYEWRSVGKPGPGSWSIEAFVYDDSITKVEFSNEEVCPHPSVYLSVEEEHVELEGRMIKPPKDARWFKPIAEEGAETVFDWRPIDEFSQFKFFDGDKKIVACKFGY